MNLISSMALAEFCLKFNHPGNARNTRSIKEVKDV
jgi:hypothetical protein